MAVPEPAPTGPVNVSDVREALQALERLVQELEQAGAEEVRTAIPELGRRVEAVREVSTTFAHALALWADPTAQERLRSLEAQIASGQPLATVSVDQLIEEIERRRADRGT